MCRTDTLNRRAREQCRPTGAGWYQSTNWVTGLAIWPRHLPAVHRAAGAAAQSAVTLDQRDSLGDTGSLLPIVGGAIEPK